ncbi:hypothetical protein [Tritonibacter mobilis]|uniref:Holin n=1 Tax=Tritonibacter mobilis F1926 TaxID=1265309 RepID=A0A1B1A1U5_9RHOB|nr:hypothetical protein [Tritonibacter mobilis]ANP40532.1 hypothetical protein K529_007120 [Tritonibacter mobilis F1926]
MQWVVNEFVGPLARRAGGQLAAALVGLGMAQQHELAVGAAVAWAIVTFAEVVVSKRSRESLVRKVRSIGEA